MGDGPRGIEVFEDHFQASTSGEDSMQSPALSKYIGSNDSLRIDPLVDRGQEEN